MNTLKVPCFKLIVTLLVLGLLCQNIVLIWQTRELKKRLDLAVNKQFEPGEVLPDFAGVDLNQQYVKIGFNESSKKFLLITFSTGCPTCHANLPNWLALSGKLDRNRWQVVWLSRDPLDMTREYCSEENISDQVLSEFPLRTYNLLGLRGVPQTLVTDSHGKIEKVWVGELDDKGWSDIASYFSSQQQIVSQGSP
jgi:peroxiredoxin